MLAARFVDHRSPYAAGRGARRRARWVRTWLYRPPMPADQFDLLDDRICLPAGAWRVSARAGLPSRLDDTLCLRSGTGRSGLIGSNGPDGGRASARSRR